MEPIPPNQNLINVIDNLECTSEKNHVKPLIPKIHNVDSSHENDEDDDKPSKKHELLSRLFYALSNLKKYDGDKDSSWCPDLALLNVKENSVSKEVKLPGHVEENIKGIKQSAHEYTQKLEEQLKDLDTADQRIEENVSKVLNDIDLIYQNLMDEICRAINKKRELLRLETEIHKNEALVPLKACRQEVQAQINSTRQLIDSIETMLNHPQIFNRERLGKIVTASVNLGRIPAVPYPEELPYINFNRPKNLMKNEIIEKISELGCVMRVGPAQILEVAERPASLFVTWHLADPEYVGEAHTFIVQKADGEVFDIDSDKFETVYEGSDMYCFIRDLPINKLVTLRIRVLATDTTWSAFKIARTTIPAYSWGLENKNYMVTNDAKIIAKITNNISTIFSQGPQFDVDHIIEFKFLETSQDAKDDEGIALVHDPQGDDDVLKRNKSLLITPRGKIFMDGEEKLMKLPRIRFGTKVIFTNLFSNY